MLAVVEPIPAHIDDTHHRDCELLASGRDTGKKPVHNTIMSDPKYKLVYRVRSVCSLIMDGSMLTNDAVRPYSP